MILKKLFAAVENFFYRIFLKNLLKLSKLGYGFVVTGAESGVNFEHVYNNRPEGKFLLGKFIDKALLDLPAVHSTRGRKEDIKRFVWNEIENNKSIGKKTKVLDLASGGARYLRELAEYHNNGDVESVCVDKDKKCVRLGRDLSRIENLKNIRFVYGDVFNARQLKSFSRKRYWQANVIIASGFFIYFNNEVVEKVIREIFDILPTNGMLIFSSYERLDTKKLMRKTMATSKGEEWTLYYRKPEYWRALLCRIGFHDVFVLRDQWQMNNICSARK